MINIEKRKTYLEKWRSDNAVKQRIAIKRWRKNNPDKYLAIKYRYDKNHPEKKKENDRKYYLRNKEKIKENSRKWRLKNPDKFKQQLKDFHRRNPLYDSFKWKKRRAVELGAEGEFTEGEWELLKKQYGYICRRCSRKEPEIKLTADHIIPLTKGGSNYIENIQPLCRSCNSWKHTKIIKFESINDNHIN